MKIFKRRIRNPKKYLNLFKSNEEFFITIPVEGNESILRNIGFSLKLSDGEQVLPGIIGPITMFNAEGKYIKLKELPLERVYRQSEWSWKDWGGTEHSKIVDIPYSRYPREYIEAPSFEFKLVESKGKKLVVSKVFINEIKANNGIKHCMNLFLEIFRECELLTKSLASPIATKTISLNWEILPAGEYVWEKVKNSLAKSLEQIPKGNVSIVKDRVDKISKLNPTFCATGKGGFNGYLVYGFIDKPFFILESVYNNNATYILGQNWKEISKFTKKSIISGNHHLDRIIHNSKWTQKLQLLFK